MNNKTILIIIFIIVVVGGIYLLNKGNSTPTKQPVQSAQPTSQISQPTVSTDTITIRNFAFTPGTLTVKQGAKVTWVNEDSVAHKIKADAFNSTNLNQGDKYEFVFNDKGTFDYICGIHPSMTGKIVVE